MQTVKFLRAGFNLCQKAFLRQGKKWLKDLYVVKTAVKFAVDIMNKSGGGGGG